MQEFLISCDWLQAYCNAPFLHDGTYYGEWFTVKNIVIPAITVDVQQVNTVTPMFLKVFHIFKDGQQVATVTQEPRVSSLRKDMTLIKLHNRILYCEEVIKFLYQVTNALRLHVIGITRLDLCYDCNLLKGGRSVPEFLMQYLTARQFKPGHIIRKGSNRFSCYGSRRYDTFTRITGMRWGSPRSAIGAYCYNKTLELIENKDKPYIRECWDRAGLLSEVDNSQLELLTPSQRENITISNGLLEYCVNSVWRFEISIKADGRDILDIGTGELFKLTPEYLIIQGAFERLFYEYAEKAFFFQINTGQKNTRYYPRLELFEQKPVITRRPVKIAKQIETGRTEKVCFNLLTKIKNEFQDLSKSDEIAIDSVRHLLQLLGGVKEGVVRLREVNEYIRLCIGKHKLSDIQRQYFEELTSCGELKHELYKLAENANIVTTSDAVR